MHQRCILAARYPRQYRRFHWCCNTSCCNCRCRWAAPNGTGSLNGCAFSYDPNFICVLHYSCQKERNTAKLYPPEIAGELLSASPMHSGQDDCQTMISLIVTQLEVPNFQISVDDHVPLTINHSVFQIFREVQQ